MAETVTFEVASAFTQSGTKMKNDARRDILPAANYRFSPIREALGFALGTAIVACLRSSETGKRLVAMISGNFPRNPSLAGAQSRTHRLGLRDQDAQE